MNIRSLIIAATLLSMASLAWAEEARDGPRTGYFRKTTTPTELLRQNRYVFIAGSNDPALNVVRKAAIEYKGDGIKYTDLFVMPNQRQEMPGPKYLERALEFLDNPTDTPAAPDDE